MKNVPVNVVVQHLNQLRLEFENEADQRAIGLLFPKLDRLVYALEFYEEAHPLIDAARPERRKSKKRRSRRRKS
jgi:hypothetical protein